MTTHHIQSLINNHQATVASAQFIDRHIELAAIWKQYEAARQGSTRVVFVEGAIGIGKTRLLDIVAARAKQDGATVLRGSTSELEGMPPYLPFLEALGHYIRVTPVEQLHKQVAGSAQILGSMLPELAMRLGEPAAAPPLPPNQILLRLYEAIGMFLEAMSQPNVLLLAFDDLQWADAASLELLCFLVKHHPEAKLLIVGTYREGAPAQNPALERAITALIHQRTLTELMMSSFSAKDIASLATNRLGAPLCAELNQLLYAQSEGNPFFAEELLQCWMERGLLVYEGKAWRNVAPLAHVLPASIIGVLRLRFAQLPSPSIDHLRVAAIIGRTFDLALLAQVEGQEVEALEESLAEAERAGLVRSDHTGMFTFNHDMIRECLYKEVSTSRRKRLHQTIGTLLEARYTQANVKSKGSALRLPWGGLAELAFHFTQSGDQSRSILYAQQAAEQALYSSACKDAMTYYRIALTHMHPDDERRGTLLLGLGKAALQAGVPGEAVQAYQEAGEHFAHSHAPDGAMHAAHGLGLAYWQAENLPAAHSALEQALTLAENHENAHVLQVLVDLSTLLIISTDQQAQGISYAQQALELADRLGEDQLTACPLSVSAASLHHLRGLLAYQREEYTTAEQEFLAATPAHQKTPLCLAGLLGLTYIARGKHQNALNSLAQLEALLAELPEGSLSTALPLNCLALLAIVLNDQKRMQAVYPKLAAFRGQHHLFSVARVLGELATAYGDVKAATIHLAEAEAQAQRAQNRSELARTLLAQARLELTRNAQGNTTRARELLKRTLGLFEELHLPHAAASTRQLQENFLSRQHTPTRRTYPVGLTSSEAKVLQFVVQGKSNRQIAQGLGISEKTVANHLSHIFYKTRSDNRAAAAAFAIRHGLE